MIILFTESLDLFKGTCTGTVPFLMGKHGKDFCRCWLRVTKLYYRPLYNVSQCCLEFCFSIRIISTTSFEGSAGSSIATKVFYRSADYLQSFFGSDILQNITMKYGLIIKFFAGEKGFVDLNVLGI